MYLLYKMTESNVIKMETGQYRCTNVMWKKFIIGNIKKYKKEKKRILYSINCFAFLGA